MSEIKNWTITIDNNDVDGIDMHKVRGTREQVVDYVKGLCFDCLTWGDEAENISFGEVNEEKEYRCCVQFSRYHVEIDATVEDDVYESLENRELAFEKFDSIGNLDEDATILWYELTNTYELSEEEAIELLGGNHVDDLQDLFETGGELDVFSSVEECGSENSENGCREEDDTDESFGQFLIQNYKNNSCGYKDICIELKTGRVIQAIA